MKIQFKLMILLTFCGGNLLWGQAKPTPPELQISKEQVTSQLYFLASDFLEGRNTGSKGGEIAANYLAAHLRSLGYSYAPGLDSYFQTINFEKNIPPTEASLMVGASDYAFKDEFIMLAGDAVQIDEAKAVFAGHGWVDEEAGIDDYKGVKVKGKVVFVISGRPDDSSPQATFQAMAVKRKLAAERGAVALVELYRLSFPWNFFTRYFGKASLGLPSPEGDAGSLAYGWMKEKSDNADIKALQDGKKIKVSLSSSGYAKEVIPAHNVVGVLEGSNPDLKDEYVILSAHYDHVGVGKEGGGAFTEQDSIFNGARDNGMGSIALMTAAEALARERPQRSTIVLWVTGEEKGLLGSRYYADNPLIPLDKCVYNLNTDGAGYNSTEHVAVIGYGRTGTDDHIQAAAKAVGLEVFPDPAPEQGLFDRSDNVSFAAKGVPALNYSPGLTSFDAEIQKYYHQVADNPENVDPAYLLKYCQSFAHLARLISNMEELPFWVEGDKYEQVGKELYGKE